MPVTHKTWTVTIDPLPLEITNMPMMPNIMKGVAAIECNAAQIVARVCMNQRTGKLKPCKPFPKISTLQDDTLLHASANYVWRILCFDLCDFRPHNSLPCTAIWDLNNYYWLASLPARPDWLATLDETIAQIEATIPANEHYGALRWGYAHDCLAAHADKKKE
jgi:hypothetical protein